MLCLIQASMPEMNQRTTPVRAEPRDRPATGGGTGGWRVLGAWKADPVHCREAHSLDLTFLQGMGTSLARHWEGKVQRVWRPS